MSKRTLLAGALLAVVMAWAATAVGETAVQGYALGPEDVLEISVWRDPELTREVVVRPDGGVSFPLVGDVQAEGRTVDELRAEIKDRLREYIPDAPVTVMLLKVQNPCIYIVGKVPNPGVHVLGQEMTVLQALALAGGPTPFADTDSIRIVRMKNGRQEVLEFSYDAASDGEGLDKNVLLRAGDTIIIP
ncbi:MAG: polysaccharide biosynthesis/export family protein [Desulfovibrionaceae bacterium]